MQDIKNKINLTSQSPKRENAFSKERPPQTSFNKNKQTNGKLKLEEKRFRAFIEHSSDIIVLVNMNGVISYINPAVEKVLGFKPEERIGASGFELVHPDDKELLADAFNTLAKDTNTHVIQGEMRLRHKDGSWRTLEAAGSKLVNDTAVEAIIVNYRDITERKRMQEKLHLEEQRFRALAEQSSDIIVLVNREGLIIYHNPALDSMLGFKVGERSRVNVFDIVHPEDLKVATDTFNYMISNVDAPNTKFEIRLCHQDGSWHTFELLGSKLVQNNVVETIIVNLRDITERKKAEEALQESERRYRELSIIDDLTKLYNSRHFYAQLKREIDRSNRYGQPLTLLLLDLDEFKAFNDAYGHVEGDYVLSRFGQIIKLCLRETDSAYRYGGEEFTIMLPMTTDKEAIVTAKRIQTEFKKEVFSPLPGQNVHVTVSIGLAQYKTMEEMKSFVHRVDRIMYKAKKSGRDRICFQQSIRDSSHKDA